jgi:DNA gyrase subunit A
MAKQLNMLSSGQVISTALHTEMQQSYLEYAMSVIVGRALPDVRDGLKPVHRRILYAMHELGLTPDRPYRKCARVVGDVLGKYHPHGDQAVYDALVRMVQDFSSRYPLLAGHGNFGSVDNDPPAAMRYTETRLAAIGNESLLTEIGEATVDFIPNFDNSQQEPSVLPSQLPVLLLNGSSGIAVGMATNIPPHNLNEVVDGLIALIDNPNLSDDRLFEFIPGPDFPTGGEIVGTDGIREAYRTGRGSVPIRGIAQIEEVNVGRGRHRRTAIVVTELPYQVNKAAWIEKVAELVTHGKLDGIADIRDESDRDGIRVVIELKRESNPHKILNYLYKQTALQANFGVIMLALADGRPSQMPLRDLLQHFINFREQTLTRRYTHDLQQAENRIHLVEGLLDALENLDGIIDILRNAPDGSSAKATLQEEFEFSDRQADAILAMPLRRLTGLERQNLQSEFEDLTARLQELRKLLGDRRELLKAMKKELRSLKKKYGDERRTRIIDSSTSSSNGDVDGDESADSDFAEEEIAEETVVEVTQRGYVRRISPKTFQRQNRNRNGDKPTQTLEQSDDFVTYVEHTDTQQDLVVLTRSGKAFPVRVGDLPASSGKAKGTPLVTLLPNAGKGEPESMVANFLICDETLEKDLLLITQQGKIKRLPFTEFADMTGRGLNALKLKEGDELLYAMLTQLEEQVVLATASGRILRFEVNDEQLPIMSRTAQGNQGMRLRKQDQLIGAVTQLPDDRFLMISEMGYVKQMAVEDLRLASPGEIGVQGFRFNNQSDALISLVAAPSDAELMVLTNADRMARIPINAVPTSGREKSDRLLVLPSEERIVNVTLLPILENGESRQEEDAE